MGLVDVRGPGSDVRVAKPAANVGCALFLRRLVFRCWCFLRFRHVRRTGAYRESIGFVHRCWRLISCACAAAKNWLSAVAIGGLFFGVHCQDCLRGGHRLGFFVDQHSAGFELLVWDHIVAGVVGAILALDIQQRYDPLRVKLQRLLPAAAGTLTLVVGPQGSGRKALAKPVDHPQKKFEK